MRFTIRQQVAAPREAALACDARRYTMMALLLSSCAASAARGGPLPVRNQHPAQLTVLHMAPAATSVLPAAGVSLRADAAYSSLFLGERAGSTSFRMDGEYLRVATALRAGLGHGLEFGIELPIAHTSGGFLDAFVIDYHDWFGFPDQNREVTPRNDFDVEARVLGVTAWSVEPSSAAWLDVPLSFTWQAREPDEGPGIALRGAVELPTGDDRRGYGNGELDWSVGVVLEHHADAVAFYAHLQHTFAGSPPSAGIQFADVTSCGLSAELPLLTTLHGFAQIEYETSTLRKLRVRSAERDQILLWIGARWQAAERWAIECAFGEDLQSQVSPDFTAWLGFTTTRPAGRAGAVAAERP